MNTNQALKYEFRGFRLMKAEYNRMLDKPLTGFSFITKKNTFDENNQICELVTEIELIFSTEICRFTFSSGYKIHDLQWIEEMADKTIINTLFPIVFPYIREKVQSFTSDFRPGVLIPSINSEVFDFSMKISFNFERKEKRNDELKNEIVN